MKRIHTVCVILFGVAFASLATTFARAPDPVAPASTADSAVLTRGAAVKLIRQEIGRAFALHAWHRYSSYIDEYDGADADKLYSLSTLDRATAVGNPKSSVWVIVYADYECPYCRRFETESSEALHKRFDSDSLFLFRFFPLGIHGKIARTEAIAGACLARVAGAEAFRRYTAEMYEGPEGSADEKKKKVERVAAAILHGSKVNLDPGKLKAYYDKCTTSDTGAALIAPGATFRGVSGTPTIFVVNIKQHKAWRLAGALPTWVFEAMIDNVTAGQPGNSDWAVEQHRVKVPGL